MTADTSDRAQIAALARTGSLSEDAARHAMAHPMPVAERDPLPLNDRGTARISPTGCEGGLLCPSCLCKRAHEAGVECRATWGSGPFCEPPSPDVREAARDDRVRRLVRFCAHVAADYACCDHNDMDHASVMRAVEDDPEMWSAARDFLAALARTEASDDRA